MAYVSSTLSGVALRGLCIGRIAWPQGHVSSLLNAGPAGPMFEGDVRPCGDGCVKERTDFLERLFLSIRRAIFRSIRLHRAHRLVFYGVPLLEYVSIVSSSLRGYRSGVLTCVNAGPASLCIIYVV